jgi:exopolyphosphatase/guanosine-5'-triphosphate,3'-diphosphate pyrophosphatase
MICGIVDLGSNTIRLSIYKSENDTLKLLLGKKSVAGLLGYVRDGVMTSKGVQKACSVLNNFKDILTNFGITHTYVFATASLRNITNTGEVLRLIKQATGYDIDLLSGEEEAALDFYGALHSARLEQGLLVDIGGGSTELVVFENETISNAVSLTVGSLSLSLRHIAAIVPSKDELKSIRQDVLSELKLPEQFQDARLKTICGVGGSVRAARKIYNDIFDMPEGNMVMETGKLAKVLSAYKKRPAEVLQRVMQLAPDRLHTIFAGIAALCAISEHFEASEIVVSTYGVREGYLYHKVLGGENQ